eukprot:362891-Chlamydomonas_euryale.AAC.4
MAQHPHMPERGEMRHPNPGEAFIGSNSFTSIPYCTQSFVAWGGFSPSPCYQRIPSLCWQLECRELHKILRQNHAPCSAPTGIGGWADDQHVPHSTPHTPRPTLHAPCLQAAFHMLRAACPATHAACRMPRDSRSRLHAVC